MSNDNDDASSDPSIEALCEQAIADYDEQILNGSVPDGLSASDKAVYANGDASGSSLTPTLEKVFLELGVNYSRIRLARRRKRGAVNFLLTCAKNFFGETCFRVCEAVHANRLTLQTLSSVETAAMFFVGKAHGEGSEIDQVCEWFIHVTNALGKHFPDGFSGIVKSMSKKILSKRHLHTIVGDMERLFDTMADLDRKHAKESRDEGEELQPCPNTGVVLNMLVTVLGCLRKLSKLWRSDLSDVKSNVRKEFFNNMMSTNEGKNKSGGDEGEGDVTSRTRWLEIEMSKTIKNAFNSLSSTDANEAVDDYLVFCRLLERRMSVVTHMFAVRCERLCNQIERSAKPAATKTPAPAKKAQESASVLPPAPPTTPVVN